MSTKYAYQTPNATTCSVEAFAAQYNITSILARAISFHPQVRDQILAVTVEWNPNLRTSAGQFDKRPSKVSLNRALHAEGTTEIIDTFLHEVAHAMQHFVYNKVDHGETWWEMMHQLGQKPRRCHQMNLRPTLIAHANPEDLDL